MNSVFNPLNLRTRVAVGIMSSLLIFAFAVAEASTDQKAASSEVKIDNFTFQSPSITVAPGTQVTWTNRDDIPHTVVSDSKLFKSHALDTDEKFTYTFTQPGTYRYFCSIHPKMTAEVIVK